MILKEKLQEYIKMLEKRVEDAEENSTLESANDNPVDSKLVELDNAYYAGEHDAFLSVLEELDKIIKED